MTQTAAIPIYTGQDFWLPSFDVRLRDRKLPEDVFRDIVSIEYSDDLEEIDSARLTINNWDADRRRFRYSDADTFLPGARIALDLGYRTEGGMRRVIEGEIAQLAPTFPASGQPTLAVTVLNILHRLRTEQVSRTYENKTASQIAREIAGRLGVEIRLGEPPEPETPFEFLLQDQKYDIVFLLRLARRVGYDLLVEEAEGGPRLYFGPSETTARRPTYQLRYGTSLLAFQPTLTTANQVGEVVVRYWDARAKQAKEAKATRAQLRTRGVGERGSQALLERSFSERKEIITDRTPRNPQAALELARATLERIAKDMVRASASVPGLPDLRAGSIVVIDGVGNRFNGRYFVTKTTHAIGDGGYTTRFECRREEI
jgi:phage protein D